MSFNRVGYITSWHEQSGHDRIKYRGRDYVSEKPVKSFKLTVGFGDGEMTLCGEGESPVGLPVAGKKYRVVLVEEGEK